MFLKSFMLCAALVLISTLTYAQDQQSGAKKSFDNYDVAPKVTVQAEKTAEKPKEKAPEKSAEQAKDKSISKDQASEKVSEKALEKADSTSPQTDSTPANKSNRKSARAKSALLKTIVPKHKGEGYWQDEPVNTEPVAPPPPPKIYSEVHTSITENGRLMLTSDTVIVKPAVSTKIVPTNLTESTGDEKLDEIIQDAARKNKVDPRLILEVIRQESGFRSTAVSPKGARGLMQLIPSTAARFGVNNIFDREQNVHAGTRYLKFLLDTFSGDVDLALAGYNAGENAVIRYNYQVPPYRETRDYVRSITARYRSRYHQVITVDKVEPVVVRQVPLATFASENGRVVLSNNY
jgi:soluble lytic murein transglycosylase-like protein